MTRREEIEKAAMQIMGVHPDWDALECFRVGYKEGAKWADKTMIEKACKWFENNYYDGGMRLLEEPNGGYREAYDICCGFESVQEMVYDFLKAMEE